ncbi:MAG: flagellar hook protein FlgE [Betaproteobacteria bacterium]|nr:flagellar hook protein FlgE [Betaproteobacteria bacterium]
MGFTQGLSGLNTSSRALDVISNNIANTSTVGFKSSNAIFADVYAGALTGVSSAIQIGYGSKITAVYQSFVDGMPTTTNNPLDMAIIGNGFFVVQRFDGSIAYTRNGQFDIDKDGFLVTPLGEKVMGIRSDGNGFIPPSGGVSEPLFVPKGDIDPKATSSVEIRAGNLNADDPSVTAPVSAAVSSIPRGNLTVNTTAPTTVAGNWFAELTYDSATGTLTAPPGYTIVPATFNPLLNQGDTYTLSDGTDTVSIVISSGASVKDGSITVNVGTFQPNNLDTYSFMHSIPVFDSLGGQHSMAFYFVKTSPGNWDVYTMVDNDVRTLNGPQPLVYDEYGKLNPPVGPYNYSAPLSNSAAQLNVTIDIGKLTQFGSKSSVTDHWQDGFTTGQIAGIVVSPDGVIQGRYTNGQYKDLGQVVLATFRSNQGLTRIGDNMWSESPESGPPIVGRPRSGLNGLVSGGQVEESNVDLTQELVNMIIQQRNYQANAQTIRTQDQILQTLVNLR